MQIPSVVFVKNPYSLALGTACITILVQADFVGFDKEPVHFEQAYAIPEPEAAYHPDPLEGAATLAFQHAQIDGLKAGMMAFCSFAYLDQEADEWVQIEWADEPAGDE